MRRLLDGPLSEYSMRITVEITETVELIAHSPAERHLQRIREAGFGLAIDDFGTGFSNLDRLEHLHPALVKLDRSLVVRAGSGVPNSREFAEAATKIGRAVGAKVLAEGVESAAEAEAVITVGAELLQGFRFARPVPVRDLATRITDDGQLIMGSQ